MKTAVIGVVALLVVAACGGDKAAVDSASAATPAAAAAAPSSAVEFSATPLTPANGGKVIQIVVNTDEAGNNSFSPSKVEAHSNDVLRFTLKTGVHNIDFLADSNSIKGVLPKASDMMQLPGQTLDLPLSRFTPGKYYFQCDPHAALGMKGQLEVEK